MSAMTIDRTPTMPRSTDIEPRRLNARTTGIRPATRRGRGSARARSPQARPGNAVPAPSVQTSPPTAVRGCSADRALLAAGTTSWQLTDRGIAVVLVTVLMIMVAAVAVIGLTAFRVTGDSFQGYGHAQLGQRSVPTAGR